MSNKKRRHITWFLLCLFISVNFSISAQSVYCTTSNSTALVFGDVFECQHEFADVSTETHACCSIKKTSSNEKYDVLPCCISNSVYSAFDYNGTTIDKINQLDFTPKSIALDFIPQGLKYFAHTSIYATFIPIHYQILYPQKIRTPLHSGVERLHAFQIYRC